MTIFHTLPYFVFIFSFAYSEIINSNVVIKNVERSIDLTTQLVKISSKIDFENTGKDPVKFILIAYNNSDAKIAYITAQTGDSSKVALKIQEIKVNGHPDKKFWKADLQSPITNGKTISIDIDGVWTHRLHPYPKSISQKDKQLVRYYGNHYFYSPYPVLKQTSTITLNTKNLEHFTKLKPHSQSGAVITFGPYENIQPFSFSEMEVHFESNAQFLTVTEIERTVEVSHWGNIAVEENIEVVHSGATLRGSFSRYDFQREAHADQISVKSFKTMLPAAAVDIYYRDDIGNISTSNMHVMKDAVELELRPRFPLFGGWKTHYVIGYNVPSYEYLYNAGNDFVLKMRLIDHIFDDMVVDNLTTKIILPEGSSEFKIKVPYPIKKEPNQLHFTYLDMQGRPVLVFKKSNLIDQHIQDVTIEYTFPKIRMLQEPIMVVIALYLLFILVIIYVRLDFSITVNEVSESKMRIAGYCEKILLHHDKLSYLYETYDEQLSKLKLSKDVNSFLNATRTITAEYKNEINTLNLIAQKIKSDVPEIFDKISELQKTEKTLKDLYTQQQSLYVDKLIPSKINRQAFIDADNACVKKKEECINKINSILKTLE